jgi:formate hydrogenlyase transcriptional activator
MAQDLSTRASNALARSSIDCAVDGSSAAISAVRDDLQALRAAVEGTAAGTGQDFFRSLVRHLAEAIDVQYATVCEFNAPPNGRVLAIWDYDHIDENLPFEFTTSPAGEVLSGEVAHFPSGVLKRFPNAAFLSRRHVDGYMAVPFQDSSGNVIGFLSVFDQRPMPSQPRRLFILKIFAARAAAEFERLRAERRLQKSEARYRDLYENAPTGYLTVGTDQRILDVNRRVIELLCYSAEELVGAPIDAFLPDTPAGKVRGQEVHQKYLAGESVAGWELEMRQRDGRPLWINLWMEAGRDEGGTIQPARCVFIDITDRVLAERERARLENQNLYLQEEIKADHNFEQIIGRSPALLGVLAQVSRVASTDATVLVTGETGTGKELIARAIHFASPRKDKPLVKVNCAALPAALIESELFGHEKGAFSGAISRRLGRFELADGGTIFLDEIGELPAEAQVKLLRVLQERELDRVGGDTPVRVDVRVIAATNRNLLAEVQNKNFREDLYYRLHVFPICLPPLRERREDIPQLVQFLVSKFAQRIGKRIEAVSQQTMRRLEEYAWPGNIRELENVLERAVILSTGTTLEIASDLLASTPGVARIDQQPEADASGEATATTLSEAASQALARLDTVERDHIVTVLRHTDWVVTGPHGAAQILGLNPSTLRSRIKKLGISRPSC